jgi:hypothetical protein
MAKALWCVRGAFCVQRRIQKPSLGTYEIGKVLRLNGEASRLAFAQGQTNRPHETRHGGEHDVEFRARLAAPIVSTQKPARMTVQPVRVNPIGSQPYPEATCIGVPFPKKEKNPFSPRLGDAQLRPSWAMQLVGTFFGALLLFAVFGEDAANQANRRDLRLNNAQLIDMLILINHLQSPLPWESAHFHALQNSPS